MASYTPRLSTKMGSTTVPSTVKTKAPSKSSGGKTGGIGTLTSVKMPKTSVSSKYPRLSKTSTKSSSKTKLPKVAALQAKLKSIMSASKKTLPLGMPSSAVGAPGTPPSPQFFGSPNGSAGTGPGGIGLGM